MHGQIVGRDEVIAAAADRIGAGRSVCLTGAPGMGRTTVAEAVADAVAPGSRPTWLACFDLLSHRALAPLVAALGPLDGDDDAVADAVVDRAATLVVIDDLQWADTRTLGLVPHVAARRPVLVTARQGTSAVALAEASSFEVLALPPLSPEECRAVVDAVDPYLPEALADDVVLRAGGTPLLLRRLAASAVGRSAVSDDDVDLILGDLDEVARHDLAVLGLAASPVPARLLADHGSRLLAAGLAHVADDATGRLGTTTCEGGGDVATVVAATSPHLAEVAATTLPDDVRLGLHRTLADIATGPRRARHLLAAGDLAAAREVAAAVLAESRSLDDARAASLVLADASPPDAAAAALGAAQSCLAARDALGALDVLSRHGEAIAEADVDTRALAAACEALAHQHVGNDTLACRLVDEALDSFGADTSPSARATLLRAAAEAHALVLDGATAMARALEALAIAPLEDPNRRRCEYVVAAGLVLLGRPEGLDQLRAVLGDARAREDVDLVCEVGTILGYVLPLYHRSDEGLALLDEVVALSRGHHHRLRELYARIARAGTLGAVELASPDLVAELRRVAWEPAAGPVRASTLALAAQLAGDLGDDEDADALLDQARATLPPDNAFQQVTVRAVTAELALLRGDARVAISEAGAVHRLTGPTRNGFHTARAIDAWACLQLGRTVHPAVGTIDVPAYLALEAEAGAVALLSQGRSSAAHGAFLDAAAACEHYSRRDTIRCLAGAALAARLDGDHDEAARLGEEVLGRCLAEGQAGLHRWVLGVLSCTDQRASGRDDTRPVLTVRQRQVIELIADGLSCAEIADELDVSEHTVREHLRNVRRHYGAQTSTEAAARYRRDTDQASATIDAT